MKAITLHQPWASLVASGAKEYETRSWACAYRGKIAIHAGKKRTKQLGSYFYLEPFLSVLKTAGHMSYFYLPFGEIVAVGELTAIYRTGELRPHLSEQELAFGNFADGRYAWRIENVQALRVGVPWRGYQGLWNLDEKVLEGML